MRLEEDTNNEFKLLEEPIAIGRIKTLLPFESWRPPDPNDCLTQIVLATGMLNRLHKWLTTFNNVDDYREFVDADRLLTELVAAIEEWRGRSTVGRANLFASMIETEVVGVTRRNANGGENLPVRIPNPTGWLDVLHPEFIELIAEACDQREQTEIENADAERLHLVDNFFDQKTFIGYVVCVHRICHIFDALTAPVTIGETVAQHAVENRAGLIPWCSEIHDKAKKLTSGHDAIRVSNAIIGVHARATHFDKSTSDRAALVLARQADIYDEWVASNETKTDPELAEWLLSVAAMRPWAKVATDSTSTIRNDLQAEHARRHGGEILRRQRGRKKTANANRKN